MSLLDLFTPAKKSVEQATAKVGKIRQLGEEKRQRREDLKSLAPPKSELCDNLCNLVDIQGNAHRARMRREVLNWLIVNPDKTLGEDDYVSLLCNPHGTTNTAYQPALFMILADQIKGAIRDMIDSLPDYPATGPARAERETELAKLDTEIAALEGQEVELLDEVSRLGSQLQGLGRPRRKGE